MKNILVSFLLVVCFCNNSFAQSFYFKKCKLSNAVTGNYIINLDKNLIEVNLKAVDGTTQNFNDKIKLIEKDKIVSEKIKSGKGEKIYYQYFLNSKTQTVIKLQYIKQSGLDIEIFKLNEKRESFCSDVKSGWDTKKIEAQATSKEQKQILEAKEKMKKEKNKLIECQGNDHTKWTNCKGSFKADSGHKYDGIFKNGEILKGTSTYPGGAQYVGEFKNFKPHGYGNFSWENGNKYYGEWRDGKNNGNGTKIWKDGREYSGTFKDDKLHGQGTLYYPDGKKYVGGFINGKRHGEGTFTYPDGTAFVGKFVAGKQQGLGQCIGIDGSSIPCKSKTETQTKDFSGKDTRDISLVSKKWVRISQYESNTKRGKKIMDKLKEDFEIKAAELCASKGNYKVLEKRLEVLDIDETPAYGLETKLQIGINGVVECN